MRHNDPRIRQTLNQITQSVDSAQYSTRASLFAFHQTYLAPCLSGISICLEASCAPCYTCITNAAASTTPADAARRRRTGRRRGREELSFDFYDDWEAQEEEGWGNDELDRLLAGNDLAADGQQPGRRGGMTYGGIGSRRKTGAGMKDRGAEEANIVPSSSMFGFLERLPWKIGGKGRRYRPSAADLQDVGEGQKSKTAALKKARASGEDEPLMEESESGEEGRKGRGHGRKRSGTVASRETTNSLSSRGDLFPSEDEDDAVPLDDEFAMALARRNTQGTLSDENSSRKKPGDSRAASTKTRSSKSSRSTRATTGRRQSDAQAEVAEVPSMTDLKEEEERLRLEEEADIEREREAARKLAADRGLLDPDDLQAEPPKDQTKEDPNISVHPVSSQDSRQAEDAGDRQNLTPKPPESEH
ncbi:MAG: hypothetical protein L6R40_008505 [Gallowayella cf. fulva]|nr:MAG: hypothetical protein L6R40_008505 [Xanthomendoza cf. fulva]